jgi:hypothetical protein
MLSSNYRYAVLLRANGLSFVVVRGAAPIVFPFVVRSGEAASRTTKDEQIKTI